MKYLCILYEVWTFVDILDHNFEGFSVNNSALRIMGSQNWCFGDPRTLLYTVKPRVFGGSLLLILRVLKFGARCHIMTPEEW